ncbi:hypothetical protein TIFTF001_016759 [Ficus carica]|uniref:RNase H type-1 domain-containing protein n=1 Tax=Ficus carica TaxID=3494 RepID=A0AA88D7N9_FICCA|nr:hypothetical protein TIFTF001_016759 [Ficus carica]
MVWHFDKRGEFSVRSAYKVEMESRTVGSQSGHGARCHLSHHGIKVSNLCPVCLYGLEDTKALWSCQKAREVWQSTTLWPILKLFPGGPFSALSMFLAADCSLEDVNVFCTIAWCLWQKHNKVVFEGCTITAGEIVTWAGKFMGDFYLCNGLDKPVLAKNRVVKLPWKPSEHGFLKINIDAVVNEALDYVRVGAVIRDEFGVVAVALARRIFGKLSPHVGECLAVRVGMFLANWCGFKKFVVESDASNVVKAIQKPMCRAPEANVVDDIRDLMSSSGSGTIRYASRDGNVVSHFLVNYVIS